MVTASDKLIIELPLRDALAIYRRRLLSIIGIGVGNLALLGLVLLLCLTALGATVAAAVATFLTAVGGFLAGWAWAVFTGIATFLVKHWVLVLVAVVVVYFLATATVRKGRR
jgi:hypothetical protein